jgi:hypothetical protein
MAGLKPDALNKNSADLWNMVSIQIIALTVGYNIPFVDRVEDCNRVRVHEFAMLESDNLKDADPLLKHILGLVLSNKKHTVYAVSEVIGKILNKQPSLTDLVRGFIDMKL